MQMMVQSQLWIVQNGRQVQRIFFIRNLSFIKFVFCLSLKYPQAWLFMLRKVSVFGISLKRGQWMFSVSFLRSPLSVSLLIMWYIGSCDTVVMWCDANTWSEWFFSVMVHVLGYIMAIIMNVLYFCINKVCKLFFYLSDWMFVAISFVSTLHTLSILFLSSFLSQCLWIIMDIYLMCLISNWQICVRSSPLILTISL